MKRYIMTFNYFVIAVDAESKEQAEEEMLRIADNTAYDYDVDEVRED